MIRIGLTAALIIALQGCALAGTRVSGRIIDIDTGKPISDAYVYAKSGRKTVCPVELGVCSFIIFTAAVTKSDKNGYYQFHKAFQTGLVPTSQVGYVIVYKPGYVTAPEMLANLYKGASPGEYIDTPEEYVAGNIPPQYFLGTGDYEKDYNGTPLNSKNVAYYLTSQPVEQFKKFDNNVTPRVQYLYSIQGFQGGGKFANKERSLLNVIFPIELAMYNEATSLAKTRKDAELVDDICRKARGISNKDDPCNIDDGPP